MTQNATESARIAQRRTAGSFADRLRAIRRTAFDALDRKLPHASLLDSFFLLARFVRAHGRLPRRPSHRDATFNDLVFARMARDDWTALERFCIDKQFAKLFVSAACPQVHLARTLDVVDVSQTGAGETAARIGAFAGAACVAKPTHGSGSVLFLRSRPGPQEVRRFCAEASRSYYERSRESQYRGLRRKLIVEEDLSERGRPPEDYKFFCAAGEVLFCQIDTGRFTDHRRCLVTAEFEPIPVRYMYDPPAKPLARPANFAEMAGIAARLSRSFPFVRVDLYSVSGKVYFGELTFAPEGGAGPLSDEAFGVAMMNRIRAAGKREGSH